MKDYNRNHSMLQPPIAPKRSTHSNNVRNEPQPATGCQPLGKCKHSNSGGKYNRSTARIVRSKTTAVTKREKRTKSMFV